jgi:mannose-6-phosphate isomerase-like protein (cupin superfamily)
MTKPYEVLSLDELDRIPVAEGLEWRPIRRRLGIRAFGTNAYTSERVGGWVVEEHVEGSGHEELYVVVSGRARFTLDGEELDAPAGTIVFLPEHDVKRKAVSEEEGTTVLAVGGWPGKPFEPSAWEWWFEAYAAEPARGVEIKREGIAELGELPSLLYHLACQEALAGLRDDATAHLRRAIELDPKLAERARDDEDLAGIEA